MRVLVVDDDKLVAVSLKTILEADGEITVVGLGEAGDDAIRLYREQHPDILLPVQPDAGNVRIGCS